jgi:hypothetical protein
LISALLPLLYAFGFSRLSLIILSVTTVFIVYLLFHPRNQWLVADRSRVDGAESPIARPDRALVRILVMN